MTFSASTLDCAKMRQQPPLLFQSRAEDHLLVKYLRNALILFAFSLMQKRFSLPAKSSLTMVRIMTRISINISTSRNVGYSAGAGILCFLGVSPCSQPIWGLGFDAVLGARPLFTVDCVPSRSDDSVLSCGDHAGSAH